MPETRGHTTPLRVLLIGASGTFGSRLAEGLVAEPGIRLTLAGRRAQVLEGLSGRLSAGSGSTAADRAEIAVVDRRRLTPDDLSRTDIVIDAAGPFQGGETAVIEAAIEARCHYIDLADRRDFVAAIPGFDEAARAAGIAVLSGASTTPALSHAVIDELTAGWRRIDTLRVAVCPGNRAPRGLAVIRSILAYVGRPVSVFREGGWAQAPGWGLTRRVEIPGLGGRLASLCETPDLDLMVARYQPRAAAEFLAGLELPLLHHGLSLVSLLVRGRLLRSLVPLAPLLRWLADGCLPFGSDRGGMLVEANGQDVSGQPLRSTWSLVAEAGVGPTVPTLAALLLVRQIRDGLLEFRGAAACAGLLELADYSADFDRLGIVTGRQACPLDPSLFQRLLGPAFDELPQETRTLHRPSPVLIADGVARVDGATNPFGRLVASLLGFPRAGESQALRVVIEAASDGSERWSRVYPTRIMRSVMTAPDRPSATLEERFGFFAIRLRIEAGPEGLTLTPVSGRWWRLPLPLRLMPRVRARETAEPGRHCFDVTIGLPLIGRLVAYRGSLALDLN